METKQDVFDAVIEVLREEFKMSLLDCTTSDKERDNCIAQHERETVQPLIDRYQKALTG